MTIFYQPFANNIVQLIVQPVIVNILLCLRCYHVILHFGTDIEFKLLEIILYTRSNLCGALTNSENKGSLSNDMAAVYPPEYPFLYPPKSFLKVRLMQNSLPLSYLYKENLYKSFSECFLSHFKLFIACFHSFSFRSNSHPVSKSK